MGSSFLFLAFFLFLKKNLVMGSSLVIYWEFYAEVLFWSPGSQTMNFTGGTAEANEIRDMSKIPL